MRRLRIGTKRRIMGAESDV